MRFSASSTQRGSTGLSSGQRAIGLVVGAIGVGLLIAAPAMAAPDDGGAYVTTDVQCDGNDNGVLDLTLINEGAADAHFVVTDARTNAQSAFTVAPQSAAAVTFTDLSDGTVAVPVSVDGVASAVAVSVACDPPQVEVLPPVSPSPVIGGARQNQQLPTAGSATDGLITGAALVAAGIAVSLIARRRYS
jgi:hypothetical protein